VSTHKHEAVNVHLSDKSFEQQLTAAATENVRTEDAIRPT